MLGSCKSSKFWIKSSALSKNRQRLNYEIKSNENDKTNGYAFKVNHFIWTKNLRHNSRYKI
jgi:hypothetical protein